MPTDYKVVASSKASAIKMQENNIEMILKQGNWQLGKTSEIKHGDLMMAHILLETNHLPKGNSKAARHTSSLCTPLSQFPIK
jgi:hypothetical protein